MSIGPACIFTMEAASGAESISLTTRDRKRGRLQPRREESSIEETETRNGKGGGKGGGTGGKDNSSL